MLAAKWLRTATSQRNGGTWRLWRRAWSPEPVMSVHSSRTRSPPPTASKYRPRADGSAMQMFSEVVRLYREYFLGRPVFLRHRLA